MTATVKTGILQEPSSSTPNITLDSSGGVTIGQNLSINGTFTSFVNLAPGTATTAPLKFQSGTNLTTAAAGAEEYDGKVQYFTPQAEVVTGRGALRGVVPAIQYYRLNSNFAGSNVATAQSVFGSGATGVGVTLASSTVYEFESHFVIAKTAGATDHSINLGFGGSATVTNILYSVLSLSDPSALPISTNAPYGAAINTVTASKVTISSTNTTMTRSFTIRGTVSINAGGTFIPQYTCTAAPGGAYSTVAGSYFLIYPISTSGSNTNVGTWA